MSETLSHLGQNTLYRIDAGSLVVLGPSGSETRLDLATISRVRLANLGDMRMCDLQWPGGKSHCLSNDDRKMDGAYAGIVAQLHEVLASRGPAVEFVRGSWFIGGLVAAIGAVTCGLGLAVHLGWIALPDGLQGKANLLMMLCVAWLVVGPFVIWRGRPRAYDPRALPRDLVGA